MTFIPKAAGALAIGVGALVIDEKTGVSVGTLCAVGGGLLAATWILSRKIQVLTDHMVAATAWREEVRQTLYGQNLALNKLDLERQRILDAVNGLPCKDCKFFVGSQQPVKAVIEPNK